MRWDCSMHGISENSNRCVDGNINSEGYLRDLDENNRIILKCIFKKYISVWAGFGRRQRKAAEFRCHDNGLRA